MGPRGGAGRMADPLLCEGSAVIIKILPPTMTYIYHISFHVVNTLIYHYLYLSVGNVFFAPHQWDAVAGN